MTLDSTISRLGVLGGSFDPPHLGHLHAAEAALATFNLERVLFIPAARPPHKPGRRLAAGEQRVELLRLLINERPEFRVDARELARAGPSFTADTLREISAETSAQLHLILGTDNLAGLPDWRDVEEILALAQPIVIHREGNPEELVEALQGRLSETALERLRRGLVQDPAVEISSTELRVQLEVGGAHSVLLPKPLADYIERAGLYRKLP
ncbi:MAG: nicotinate-nucleotide adenylyltransferase [Planctomycetota bacterium]